MLYSKWTKPILLFQQKQPIISLATYTTISSLTVLGLGIQYKYNITSTCSSNSNYTSCEKSSSIPPRYGSTIPNQLLFQQRRHLTTIDPSDISKKENRNECVICKKYSRGPCGDLFKKWLHCIDTNNGNESVCDKLIIPLDECLKNNDEYYSNIDPYEDVDEEINHDKWTDFISKLESGKEVPITFEDFPPDILPQMEIRLESMMGVIEFQPHVIRDREEQHIILGYAKDDKGHILAAAASDELLNYGDFVLLRFQAPADAIHIECCAIYIDTNAQDVGKTVIYNRIQCLPVNKK
jgi:hypothetical protein